MKSTVNRAHILAYALCAATMLATTSLAVAQDAGPPQDQTLNERFEAQEERIRNLEKRLQAMESTAIPGNKGKEAAAAESVAEAPASIPQNLTLNEKFERQDERIRNLEMRLQAIESTAMSGRIGKAGAVAQTVGQAPTSEESAAAQAVAGSPASIDVSAGRFREPEVILTGAGLASKDFPGSWPMFGTDYRMKIGGYYKADALYDFDGSGDKTQFLMAEIPVEGTPAADRDDYFNMLVRETRFSFDIRRTGPGELAQKFFLEMDFFGGGNEINPRMRHAYVQYGNLIVGQTWSTTTDLRLLPFMIDFAYGDAIYGGRTKQVRWQQQANTNWSWAVGLEKIDYSGIDSQGLPGEASPQLPLLGGRVTYEDSSMVLNFGAELKPLRWDGMDAGPDATATGWSLTTGGRRNFGSRDYATWNMSYGKGTADGLLALTGRNYGASLLPGGRLETNTHWNVSLGYTHKFTDFLSTNLNYAVMHVDADYKRLYDPNSLERAWIAHANLIWRVTPAMRTGIEYMWGTAENASGADGNSARAQAMLMYDF